MKKFFPQRILVIGATGMLGNAVYRFLSDSEGYSVFGSTRSKTSAKLIPARYHSNLISDVCVENIDSLSKLFALVHPNIVINCVGVVKQMAEAEDPLVAIPINAVLPHRLANLCKIADARLIHMGTDCVFSGRKGMYSELDTPDATDLYGVTKFLGEVNQSNAITLRTSIIGHELNSAKSLVNWFLSQNGSVKGYRHAIFSGLPTVEIARIIRDFVIPHHEISGVYHVSAEPINKFELLSLIALIYDKQIEIIPNDELKIDRSLDSLRFRRHTGFSPKTWPELINLMREFN